ncbi:hypothetical protein BJY01DRAFT_8249 [Aspergillus pseudoustus]|uniref:Uncharacterized protein n=1 Tax=Aspergillus pseudoustus TaxID=1810923 RepID=A0ABR4JP25_9EURO
MDHVPRKRPQRDDVQSVASPSITLPERTRGDEPAVTANGGREVLPTSAANNRKGAPPSVDGDDDADYTSSSGSSLSSSGDEDDSDNEDTHGEIARESGLSGDSDQITSLPARKKPNIRRFNNQPSVLSKLSAFLPQMKSANDDLQREIAAGRSKDIQLDAESDDDHRDGQYVEMNLGLGVLEEKRPGDDEDFSDGETNERGNPSEPQETNVMDRLMKKEKSSSSDKPSIQEINE